MQRRNLQLRGAAPTTRSARTQIRDQERLRGDYRPVRGLRRSPFGAPARHVRFCPVGFTQTTFAGGARPSGPEAFFLCCPAESLRVWLRNQGVAGFGSDVAPTE